MVHALPHLIHDGAEYQWRQLTAGNTDRVEPGKLLIEVIVDQPAFSQTHARIARAKHRRYVASLEVGSP